MNMTRTEILKSKLTELGVPAEKVDEFAEKIDAQLTALFGVDADIVFNLDSSCLKTTINGVLATPGTIRRTRARRRMR